MSADPRSIGTWLRVQTTGKTPPTMVSLRQIVGTTRGQNAVEAAKWEPPYPSNFDAWAQEILDFAEADAEATGPNTYDYAIVLLDDRGRVGSRRPFRIVAEDQEALVGPVEAPNERGVLAMMMRRDEARERLGTAGMVRVLREYERLLDRETARGDKLEARIAKLEEREVEVARLLEETASKKHEREMALLQNVQRGEERQKFVDKIVGLLPHAAAKMGMVPAQGDPELQAFVELMIKHEVPFEPLLNQLPPEGQVLLASMIKRYVPAPAAPGATKKQTN
jgi:hypothetical protein